MGFPGHCVAEPLVSGLSTCWQRVGRSLAAHGPHLIGEPSGGRMRDLVHVALRSELPPERLGMYTPVSSFPVLLCCQTVAMCSPDVSAPAGSSLWCWLKAARGELGWAEDTAPY